MRDPRLAVARFARAVALSVLALAAGSARATWSIVLVDTRTGEVAAGSATCLTSFDLRQNTPVLLTGVGAATAQSAVDSTGLNRGLIRNQLALATDPAAILSRLAQTDGTQHQSRQYGLVDTLGRTMTFTGRSAGPWAGGETSPVYGRVGDIAYAVQGNVLTGPCVVETAIQAALTQGRDLADKLMLAMEAARAAGGDGRCSCNSEQPDICGCPPATFTKSAHIAYMLVARAGDRDGSHALLRGSFSGVALGRFTGSDRTDLLAANTPGTGANLFANATADLSDRPSPPLRPNPGFADPVATPLLNGNYVFATGDLNGDGIDDVVGGGPSLSAISVLTGRTGQALAPRVDYPVVNPARAVAVGRLFGTGRLDVAAAIGIGGVQLFRNTGGGALTLGPQLTTASSATTGLELADLDGDGQLDVLALIPSRNVVRVWRNVGGTFPDSIDLAVGSNPFAFTTGDFNADGRTDLLVIYGSVRTVRYWYQDAAGNFPTGTAVTLSTTPSRVYNAGDLDGDGRTDAVVLFTDRVGVLLNAGIRPPTVLGPFTLWPFSTAISAAVGDLNGDGRPDVAVSTSAGLQVLTNRGDGSFPSGNGFATGDYFLTLNVANQTADNADPVIQLRQQYDPWREGRAGRADAIRSTAAPAASCLRADGASTLEVIIDPRDAAGLRVRTPLAVSAVHAPGSSGRATIGPASPNPDGTYTLRLAGATRPGEDRLAITLDNGVRPVTLMPYLRVAVSTSTDYNRDGTVNLDDLCEFITDFYTSPPIPGGAQPAAPTFGDRVVGYATPCPLAADAPPPYAADAYRVSGFRAGYSPDGADFSVCPPLGPSLDNLGDYLTAFYALPDRCVGAE